MRTRSLILLTASLVFAACRGGDTTGKALPNFVAEPTAVALTACPLKDSSGNTVPDVFPEEKKFTLRNLGKAGGTVSLTLSGADKDSFSLAPDRSPTELAASESGEVPVRFSPSRAGDAHATVEIDDGSADTEPVTVSLVGTGSSLPAQPQIQLSYQSKDNKTSFIDCPEPNLCLPYWPDTFEGESSVLQIKVTNAGCPALKITGIELGKNVDTQSAVDFKLETPAAQPTVAAPMVLTSAGGNESTLLSIRFTPKGDGTFDEGRYAKVTLHTNDPSFPTYEFTIYGAMVVPSLNVTPDFCNFSESTDLCGLSTKNPTQASFTVENTSSSQTLTIADLVFAKGGQGGRFSFPSNFKGKQIAPGASAALVVTYTDAPLFVSDQLTLFATALGQSAGSKTITLFGGVLPNLETNPDNQLVFDNPTEEFTKKPLVIKNGTGGGDLIINRVFVDPNNFFSIPTPPAAGTRLKANETLSVDVQYKKPTSGGTQTGVLRVDTNDPDFGPEPYKVVTLQSNAALDQLPVAVIKGRKDSGSPWVYSSINVSLVALGGSKVVELSGQDSSDPVVGGPAKKVAKLKFTLVKKPTGASGASLANDATKIDAYTGSTANTVSLTLDSKMTGEYKVVLQAYDDVGQASANTAEYHIYVGP